MATTKAPPTTLTALPAARPSLRRTRSDRLVAGVAGGVARHLGLDPHVVRLAFIVLSFAAGFGVIVYLLLWLLAPLETVEAAAAATAAAGEPHGTTRRPLPRPTTQQLVGLALILVGVATLFLLTGYWFGWELGWPSRRSASRSCGRGARRTGTPAGTRPPSGARSRRWSAAAPPCRAWSSGAP